MRHLGVPDSVLTPNHSSQRDPNRTLPRHERCSNQVAARFDIADATTTPSTITAHPLWSEVPVDLLLARTFRLVRVSFGVTGGASMHPDRGRLRPVSSGQPQVDACRLRTAGTAGG